MNLTHYLLLIISVLAGGGIAFVSQQFNRQHLQLVLSFSGAYVLGITVLHLMPNIYTGVENSANVGLWVLAGFVLQLLLETFSSGVEHGHIHATRGMRQGRILAIMFGLCIHAFLEGLPLHGYVELHHQIHNHGEEHSGIHLLYGIILHKAPAAFALISLLLLSDVSKAAVITCLVVFASMSPLGAYIAYLLDINVDSLKILLALVVGSFLHIATTILFEIDNTHHHRISWPKLLAIAVGLAIAIMTMH